MAIVLLSSTSMTQSGIRSISMRGAVMLSVGAAVLLMASAFAIGLQAGKSLGSETATVKAQDPVQANFTITRLGELTGRLLRLESDAAGMVKSLSNLEGMERKLSMIQSGMLASAVAPQDITLHHAAGGPALPPRGCDTQDLQHDLSKPTVDKMARTEQTISCFQHMLFQIQQATAARNVAYMAIPSQRPVEHGEIGSPFGNRIDPINGRLAFHSGLDFAADFGSPIYSAGGGRVKFAGFRNEMGNMVEIDHGNGLVTRYAHASKLYVKTGDVVAQHQLLAAVGSTGRSTGPHVHFEVLHEGRYVDPQYYLSLGTGVSGV
ncbi:MAG TPA: M23 family metallopeptidase [Rhodocyclaceae bacterium]|nr:M23 family metallopeptidase [Rhodocyclaceae bacterium]